MSAPELLSITEVAHASGLASSALRYYERAGLITSVARSGGRRQYHPDVLRRLGIIRLLKDAGFSLSEISELVRSKGRGQRWRAAAAKKLEELNLNLDRVTAARDLLQAALACECSSLENCGMVSGRSHHERALNTIPLGKPGAG